MVMYIEIGHIVSVLLEICECAWHPKIVQIPAATIRMQ